MCCVNVWLHRALTAISEVIVVGTEDHDLVCESSATRQNARDIYTISEGVSDGDAARDSHRKLARARSEIAIDFFLKLEKIDTRRLQPFLSNRSLHLQHGQSGCALRTVILQYGNFVFSFILLRT